MKLKLISWNVNGYRSALNKGLRDFVQSTQPDIICLQEIKASTEVMQQQDLALAGYLCLSTSASKPGYSGVATFVKDGLSKQLIHVAHGINHSLFDTEGRFVITEFAEFSLYNVYIPSGTSGDARQDFKYKFLDTFFEHLNSLSKKQRARLIICGDFNICHKEIDIHHPKEATKKELTGFLPAERAWLDHFVDSGFVDCFRLINADKQQFSWWSFRANSRAKNLGWRIDYFFVAQQISDFIKDAKILEHITGSDHCPISLDLEF